MATVTYEVVEHEGGYAYRVGDVYSETFATHQQAHAAAVDAAERQKLAGETVGIRYEDADGNWHDETARGDDRPETGIIDEAPDHR